MVVFLAEKDRTLPPISLEQTLLMSKSHTYFVCGKWLSARWDCDKHLQRSLFLNHLILEPFIRWSMIKIVFMILP